MANELHTYHHFIDEAGDTAFFNNHRKVIIGSNGVSKYFLLGILTLHDPIREIRSKTLALQNKVGDDPYNQVPSVLKKKQNHGYFLHAKDDIPEIRAEVFKFIRQLDCSFTVVGIKKDADIFLDRYESKAKLVYADILSQLVHNHMILAGDRVVFNIADRATSTKNANLEYALELAHKQYEATSDKGRSNLRVAFQVSNPTKDAILNIADYLCWAVQRSLERGDSRYLDFISDKIKEIRILN